MMMKLSIFAALAIALSVAPALAQSPQLQLRADIWCPHNCDPTSDKPGYMVEIAAALLKERAVTLSYALAPWARALVEAKAGGIDGVIGANKIDARGLILSTRPFGASRSVLVVRAGEGFAYQGPESFGTRRLGVILDYSYDEAIDAWIAKHKSDQQIIQTTSGGDALLFNLRKLVASRVDVVIEDHDVVTRVLAAIGLLDKVEFIPAGEVDPLFIALSPMTPKASETAALLGEGIDRLRRSGELGTILARYGVSDWE